MVFFKTPADQYDCGAGAFEAEGGGRSRLGGWHPSQKWVLDAKGLLIRLKMSIC